MSQFLDRHPDAAPWLFAVSQAAAMLSQRALAGRRVVKHLPLFFDLAGRRVVVVGEGPPPTAAPSWPVPPAPSSAPRRQRQGFRGAAAAFIATGDADRDAAFQRPPGRPACR
jgi:hypothetical protein